MIYCGQWWWRAWCGRVLIKEVGRDKLKGEPNFQPHSVPIPGGWVEKENEETGAFSNFSCYSQCLGLLVCHAMSHHASCSDRFSERPCVSMTALQCSLKMLKSNVKFLTDKVYWWAVLAGQQKYNINFFTNLWKFTILLHRCYDKCCWEKERALKWLFSTMLNSMLKVPEECNVRSN